ncbi:peptidase M24, structural domain-containing protein [Mucor mucedo]|uniref:peptidase M24, structural domain-containing protein n=1 Tax=Mucor mucedo TaxID=29922 RepID=UPI00221F29B3|nr:peptidase M24, structural domain-containing protein [Mucor mucedo]KAI7881735.1 peptidase M24, structural domain-containing protein [Mucor mucedo]
MKVDAFVIPTEDAHQSEYTAECDNRRSWLSGFTGSAGCAIVTREKAALFTDGRYFLQASQELDLEHWKLMKQGLPGVPTWQEYLIKDIPANSSVGIDPSVISADEASKLEKDLGSIGSRLIYLETNPVDQIRRDRPQRPSEPVHVHPIQYAGKSVQSKLNGLRSACDGHPTVISSLDEIAWLLNLRGADIHCSPVFFSYCLVTKDDATLYIQPSTHLSTAVKSHLAEGGVHIKAYENILEDLKTINDTFSLDPHTTNMSILGSIQHKEYQSSPSYISLAKAVKNPSELNGMRQCHKRDAVALCKHFSWLSHSLKRGDKIREFEAASHLESMRATDRSYVGPSFDTIAATGPNGAIIHYQPHETDSAWIDPTRVYLCDSGAQYVDGTTDITRTFLFDGVPTQFQKRAFTRVLQSHIAVDTAIFPQGTTGYQLDAVARVPLWKDGLNFRHGVGHGVGAHLNVHEGPHGIGSRLGYNNVALQPGMVVTNEPGYYEDGQFGIRLENIMTVRRVNTAYRFGQVDSLGFEHITFVPFGKTLVETELMTKEDKLWLNAYHQECRDILEPLIKDSQTLTWIERETEPIIE